MVIQQYLFYFFVSIELITVLATNGNEHAPATQNKILDLNASQDSVVKIGLKKSNTEPEELHEVLSSKIYEVKVELSQPDSHMLNNKIRVFHGK